MVIPILLVIALSKTRKNQPNQIPQIKGLTLFGVYAYQPQHKVNYYQPSTVYVSPSIRLVDYIPMEP
jgi:hypothetical protein